VASSDWPVIVDWSEADLAGRRLEAWLRANGFAREAIEDQIRCDISRSLSGVLEYRYAVSPEVLAHVEAPTDDIARR